MQIDINGNKKAKTSNIMYKKHKNVTLGSR